MTIFNMERAIIRKSVLFVCLGNICRSPLAEGIFLDLLARRGLQDRFRADSCGTGGWHVGEPADRRAQEVARAHGVALVGVARKLDPTEDFDSFDLILAMDRQNRRDLLDEGAPADRVRLLRSFDPALRGRLETGLDVPDPYWDEADGFRAVFQMIHAACEGLLDELVKD